MGNTYQLMSGYSATRSDTHRAVWTLHNPQGQPIGTFETLRACRAEVTRRTAQQASSDFEGPQGYRWPPSRRVEG